MLDLLTLDPDGIVMWSSLFFLVGMAGWYGANFGTNNTIASDFIDHVIANSIANTNLSTLTIPANAINGLQLLRYEVFGSVLQNTGIAQNMPTISIDVSGTTMANGGIITSLPNSLNTYSFKISVLITMVNGLPTTWNTYISIVWNTNSGATPAPALVQNFDNGSIVYTPGIVNTINVHVINAVANPSYSTVIHSAILQAA